MIDVKNIMGRLGNQMFFFAFAYAYARDHSITDSYFPQNEAWFEDYKKEIKIIFGKDIGEDSRVGIHVRRTDYLDPNRVQYGLPLEYYTEAMAHFPNRKFVVCSDDIAWCKEQEVFKDCDFSEGNEIEDMNLLASCNGIIIANSSFSWWSAYLSAEGTKVIAPLRWDKEDKVFPMNNEWIKI